MSALYKDDERISEGSGLQLSKREILAVTNYVQLWQQRQCMCCYRELKNYEKINNIAQVILNKAIWLIQNLGEQETRTGNVREEKCKQDNEKGEKEKDVHEETGQGDADKTTQKLIQTKAGKEGNTSSNGEEEKPSEASEQPKTEEEANVEKSTEDSQDNVMVTDASKDEPNECKDEEKVKQSDESDQKENESNCNDDEENKSETQSGDNESKSETKSAEVQTSEEANNKGDAQTESSEMEQTEETSKDEQPSPQPVIEDEEWTIEEKDSVFQFVTKVFLLNFPMYVAYKHMVHSPLEELSQQDATALSNFCELTDPEVPVFLLRNVCFFCDSNGIQSIAQCFDRCSPRILPYYVGHTLITLIANLRLWMNMPTIMQYIVPLRSHVIGYMCRLSDNDLRLAAIRNMTDLMWAAVKEPIEGHYSFDKEGLELAFKYFTCTTLTIRLAGITQINSQIQMYNEVTIKESMMETDSGLGNQLADWLIEHKVVEHLFGPNLHVEIIKQSELILTLLALESRLSVDHIDCMWAAGQLKHCGRTVLDILTPLIKHMDATPVQHLLRLVTDMDPAAHTEQTLFLASALIKYIWNSASNQQMAAHHQQTRHHCHQGMHHCGHTSSEHSESEEDLEEGEVIMTSDIYCGPHIRGKAARVKIPHQGMTSEDNNTDLSNVSDDSLPPSDVSESEHQQHPLVGKPRHQGHRHHRHHHHHHEGESSSEEEEDEDSEEEEICKHLHEVGHEGCKEGLSSSDGSEEEAEQPKVQHVNKQTRLKPKPHSKKLATVRKRLGIKRIIRNQKAKAGPVKRPIQRKNTKKSPKKSEADTEKTDKEVGKSDNKDSDKNLSANQKTSDESLNKSNSSLNQSSEEKTNLPGVQRRQTIQEVIEGQILGTIRAAQTPESHQCCSHDEDPIKGMQGPQQPIGGPGMRQRSRSEGQCACEECERRAVPEMMDTSEEMSTSGELRQIHAHPHVLEDINSSDENALLQELGRRGYADKTMTAEELNLYLEHLHTIAALNKGGEQHISSELIDEILSPDEASCNSSRMSAKSEKNMADFEGEDVMSEEELAHINAQAAAHHHLAQQQHADNVKYCGQSPGKTQPGNLWKYFKFEDVCKPGNTLLWDLIQEPTVTRLPEGLAIEAEKILTSLVCFVNEKRIRTRFIEACVQNLANHRSVVVSLHLLSKILGSFQQFREGDLNTHTVTKWAEKELHLLNYFFDDLLFYTSLLRKGVRPQNSLYSHKDEIQVRLQFLTCVFTSAGSPDNFKLNLEQVDTLWNCLAPDPECCDELFSWLLTQSKSKEHHALGLEAFKHVFLEKMPTLLPEAMSMIGLNLFTQLCNLARICNVSLDRPLPDEQICGMDQLWGIALKAHNTDVSLTAIQYLNSYYINYGSGALEKEAEFVQRCMDSLIEQNPESSLLMIQRGLILMTNHLESFRKRYAFHLRNWQLDGKGIFSHQKDVKEKQSSLIRVLLQPAGASERTQLEMLSTDLVAELRAEVTRWWENVQKQHKAKLKDNPELERAGKAGGVSSLLTPILGAMLGEGPIRMITGGQELSVDLDERTLAEVQLKDSQMVFVSLGAHRPSRKQDGATPPSCLPAPPRSKIPMMLLLGEPHFHRLFSLLQFLSKFRPTTQLDQQEQYSLQTKARVLSRKVWDLLMLLPTNPTMLKGFQSIGQKPQESCVDIKWTELLDDTSPHKLMYSLQIVEYLSRPPRLRKASIFLSRSDSRPESLESEMSVDDGETPEEVWSKKFGSNGGLKHLFQIFLSGTLQISDLGSGWSEWHQDCLASLLRLLSQFAVLQADAEGQEDVFDNTDSPRKKMKRMKASEKIVIPRLNKTILSMVDVDQVVQILLTIIKEAAMPPREYSDWPLPSWGRVEVIRYAFSFLVSFAHSCDTVQPALCNHPMFGSWLKRTTLEAPEPPVRQEACQGIYRLCLGKTIEGHTGYQYLMPVLASLLSNLDTAQQMRTPKKRMQEEKEPFGPACRDYFWIVCRLTEGVKYEDAVKTWEGETCLLNFNVLVQKCADLILSRGYLETRHNTVEDDGLIGLLSLTTSLIRQNPPFRSSSEGQEFLVEVFWCLFAVPTPTMRYLPKCKSQAARSNAFDLLVELVKANVENYAILHTKLIQQHSKEAHASYNWDMWPHEEERSSSGYVGLTNLGATCYMATCMQHLYMIPEARRTVLESRTDTDNKYCDTLRELKKMFAYLLESERKAYNPRSFCKVYNMDHQPLNTGEQKDMTEFFTDLITKMEEMGPELRRLVKRLFGGILTNNVVSLDCPHVSRTKEEFYTVRCQVADMRNLQLQCNLCIKTTKGNNKMRYLEAGGLYIEESLDEVTVKDMLEGDNMYTCSKCQKKVRAEKRACFKRLPEILCFNTMRYTFNMVTMMKEKVNTHFSFPLKLDMSSYMEKNLIKKERLQADESEKSDSEDDLESPEFELIGVTVHTGTAEGGHYYSFIRDRLTKNEMGQDKWYLFNDAEVKPFDCAQIATECFGGEMTSKTYDSVTDKFMDFSFEKTNSAYMLFYERINKLRDEPMKSTDTEIEEQPKYKIELSPELNDWIWHDNMQFLKDKYIFEHTYFGFLWQMCGYLPTTLPRDDPQQRVPLMTTQLGTSFVLETLIHAKEKPTMLQWIELVTKQFNSCHKACEWFLDHMAGEDWWPQQILIKCPTQLVRQMFHRLIIHVITQLRPTQAKHYLKHDGSSDDEEVDPANVGNHSCVTRFVRKMLAILSHGPRPHCKYLSEYFVFLYDFAKMGDIECQFLLQVNAISTMVMFFMSHKSQESFVEILSDDEDDDEDDVVAVHEDKYRPQSLEKMINLISLLVEKSRNDENRLDLAEKDLTALLGGKGFPFLFNQIKDCINIRQTCNLIFSLTRWNDRLASAIISMIFTAISRLGVESQPFFKMLSMLVEFVGGPPGMPHFTHYILQKFWEVADYCPQQSLEWLSSQVMRNKLAHAWTQQNMEVWVEPFLLANSNMRVRNAAAFLLVALVPSNHFRQSYRNTRSMLSPCKDKMLMSEESIVVLHNVYDQLLRLLSRAKQYCDAQAHGPAKLVPYFTVMTHCLISRTEKLMFTRYFADLWNLFQPKLSEPAISMHTNKQALLHYWHQACIDCPENVQLIVTNAHVAKNIAFNYILADHEDQDVMVFNRSMLPAYYGILRMACQASRSFTRQLAAHQNIQWAFKNITPYPGQYTLAVEELLKMMRLMVATHNDMSEDEMRGVIRFKRETLALYMQHLDARTHWQTLCTVLKILVETTDDRMLVLQRGGLNMLHEAFNTVHLMHHEATACHVSSDLVDILRLVLSMLKPLRQALAEKKGAEMKQLAIAWKDKGDFIHKLLSLLNSYQPSEIRNASFDVLKEMVITFQSDCLQCIVPMLVQCHSAFQDCSMPISVGPYFPKRGQKGVQHKMNVRPMRPNFQMFLQSNLLECTKGVDEAYDCGLVEFFQPYHSLVDLLVRVAVNQQCVSERIVQLSAMVAYEGVPLHMPLFAKLWYEMYQSENVDRKYIEMLCSNSSFIDYVDAVLLDERASLNNPHIYQFFVNFFPKVFHQVLNDQGETLFDNIMQSINNNKESLERSEVMSERDTHKILNKINGDLKALLLIFSVQRPQEMSQELVHNLAYTNHLCRSIQRARAAALAKLREQESHDRETGEEDVPRKRRKTISDSESERPQQNPEQTAKTSQDKPSKQQQQTPTEASSSQTETSSNQKEPDETESKPESTGSSSDNDDNKQSKSSTKEETCESDTTQQKQQEQSDKPDKSESVESVSKDKEEPPSKTTTTTDNSSSSSKSNGKENSSSKIDENEPKPSTSKDTSESTAVKSGPSTSSQGGEKSTPKKGGSHKGQKVQPRERPTILDLVIRNIENIFSMMGPK